MAKMIDREFIEIVCDGDLYAWRKGTYGDDAVTVRELVTVEAMEERYRLNEEGASHEA
jgi:hypothetical protein